MGKEVNKTVSISEPKLIENDLGDIRRIIDESSEGFYGFEEAYFSHIKFSAIKAWKRHKVMTSNIVVAYGKVKLVYSNFMDDKIDNFSEIVLSDSPYQRITIPPMCWFGFKGLSKNEAIILNISNFKHMPHEVERKDIEEFKYNWG